MFGYTKEINECLRKIKHGDNSQYEPLFEMTAMHLHKVAKMYLKNKSLADDVVAETFIRIFSYIKSFNWEMSGYNWMCKIIQNVAITHNVRENKLANCEQQFVKELSETSRDDYDEVDFLQQFDVLGPLDKEIAIERFYFDMTFEEIGKRHNMSKPAAFQRVNKICVIMDKNNKNK